MKPNSRNIAWFAAALCLACAGANAAISYDPAADFSATSNPNAPWSYGYSTNLASQLNLYNLPATGSGLDFWQSSVVNSETAPNVTFNPSSSADATGTIVVPADGLSLHPGPNGEYSHVLFTLPSAGTFSISGAFTGEDLGGTTTDVHILVDNSPVFSGNIVGPSGPTNTAAFDLSSISLSAGETVDFAVGFGSNGNFAGDTTGLAAVIAPAGTVTSASVPLPPAVWTGLGVMALLAASFFGFRRWRVL